MRNGIAAVSIVVLASTACISGDVDEEAPTQTVPAGTDPEAASFQIVRRSDGMEQALVIRLSTISLCDRAAVPVDHPFVEAELVVPVDQPFGPQTCKLDQTHRCKIRLLRTNAPECGGTGALSAGFGQLVIDEATEDVVRGSFEGFSKDSKIDLRGTFVARPCTGSAACP